MLQYVRRVLVAGAHRDRSRIPQPILDAFISQSPHIRCAEADHRGYFVLDVQADKTQADWYLLDGIGENDGAEMLDASWAVLDGQNHVTEMDSPETPNGGAPGPVS